ncbi:flagellar hook-basal body complex protein [Clostridium sp. 19966]|uniref:flagellar hook-basal body complex protein n=1 Tax=Clostridium sp. 19966 TaxID=2768166 RepID=UPI0028DE13B1|nr:flagellar hook-basal body complex protein [Clostridium sp. 19966]MDT8716649.1 flagellar hook-basal body complex protein [Clostridium sp. 19966]
MLRAMYSGIAGMKVNQEKLDVIGNNIANVGTTAFKTSRVRFQDMLSQSVNSAMAPSVNLGGVNASKVGLGVTVSGIDVITTQGNMQPTNRPLDVAIDGSGYFMVAKGPTQFGSTVQVNQQPGTHNITSDSLTKANMSIMYSRDGAFSLDDEGNLLNSDGYRILGYSLTNDNPLQDPTAKAPNNLSLQGFTFNFGAGAGVNGYKIELGTVSPDTVATANVDTTNKIITLNGDFSKATGITSDQAASAINKALSAAGIAETVTVAGKVTPLTTPPLSTTAFVSTTPAPTYTAGGYTFTIPTGANDLTGYSVEVGNISATATPQVTVDTKYNKIIIDGHYPYTTTSTDALGNTVTTTHTLQQAIDSALANKGITTTLTAAGADGYGTGIITAGTTDGGTPVQSIETDGVINFVDATKDMRSYDGTLKTLRIPDTVRVPGSNTYLKVTSFTIDKQGVITAKLENNTVAAIGQIATASFKNPGGLESIGGDLYSSSVNSGEATLRSGIGTTGEDNSAGYGDLLQNTLEASNVDLAEQFTDMIESSRAFQASSKMINTGDEILQDIINLKR